MSAIVPMCSNRGSNVAGWKKRNEINDVPMVPIDFPQLGKERGRYMYIRENNGFLDWNNWNTLEQGA